MAPRRKKQKIKHASATPDATVRSTAQPAIDCLPLELLQMCFEHLSFHDLIRCRHVCGKWFICIPGDDTELRKILFLTTSLPPWTRKLHIQDDNSFCKPFGNTFAMELTVPLIVTKDYRPRRLQRNPILKTMKWNKLAYPGSVEDERPNCPYYKSYSLRFSSVEQLREKATLLESRVDEGLWTDMLICVPPVQKVELRLAIHASGFCVHLTRTLADNRGIRFQGLVTLLRSLLKEVAEKLILHKVTLRYKRIIEFFDWLGDGEHGDGTFEVFKHTEIMETDITRDGRLRKV